MFIFTLIVLVAVFLTLFIKARRKIILTERYLDGVKEDRQRAQDRCKSLEEDTKQLKDKLRQQEIEMEEKTEQLKDELEDQRKDFWKIKAELNQAKKTIEEIGDLDNYRNKAEADCRALDSDIKALELIYTVGVVKVDEYEGLKSDEVKNRLTMLRAQQDELVRSENALIVTNTTAKKFDLNNQKRQILRCFNAECKSIIEAVTVRNVDSTRAKIQRSYEAINKIFLVDGVQISSDYLALKYDELSMVYAYMLKEDEEREQRRAIREQMVEEEKVRREIEQAKKRIEKEELQFSREIDKLTAYMQKAPNDVERQLYLDKISELEVKLKAVEADKENVLQREQNTRAGFVYIISNIGSFGEHIFKIGMTRRLEPMERIAELSSASVPFPFDVHAMIFSDDAPGLETILHKYFNEKRVNKVNLRKEFFKVDLDEIKQVVLKNHNATVKFIDIPEATEYRATLMQD